MSSTRAFLYYETLGVESVIFRVAIEARFRWGHVTAWEKMFKLEIFSPIFAELAQLWNTTTL